MIIEQMLTIDGCEINTRIRGKEKSTIIFIHGNSSSARSWDAQLNDEGLSEAYRLVSFDLPGHGKSSKSHDYRLKEIAKIMPALVDALGLEEYIVVGLSLGTCLAAEAAPKLKGCKGFVMVSPNIVSNDYSPASFFIPLPPLTALTAEKVDDDVLNQFISLLVFNDKMIAKEYSMSYLNTDPEFRVALGQTIATGDWSDEIANIQHTGLPICIVFGREEKAINTDYLDKFEPKWRDRVFFIEKAGHFANAEQPDPFNDLLKEFAKDVFK